jgi:hypothetical protein
VIRSRRLRRAEAEVRELREHAEKYHRELAVLVGRALSAEEINESLYRLIAVAGYAAYNNTLVGNPAPVVIDYNRRARMPQIGDLALEVSTIWRKPWPTAALGELVGFEGDAALINPLDPQQDRPTRWVNCDFIAIPWEGVGASGEWRPRPGVPSTGKPSWAST